MYITRKIESKLKELLVNYDKPIFIDGARQVGKTTMILEVLKGLDYIHINLFENKSISNIFSDTNNTDINSIITGMEDEIGQEIKKGTLIFIDEIQVNHIAFSCLKTFKEDGNYKIICSGSNVAPTLFGGSNHAYPVGQFHHLQLHPFSYEEFLQALKETFLLTRLIKGLKDKQISESIHQKALTYFDLYLEVGGMPEVIMYYIENKDYKSLQTTLFDNYINDFAKYANVKDIKYLKSIYQQIPYTLGHENQIFKSSDTGYQAIQLKDSYNWLSLSRMAIFAYKLNSIKQPIACNIKDSKFKLFLNDTGLLTNYLSYSVAKHSKKVDNIYLGQLCENYIATVLAKYQKTVTYYHDKIEIDFVFYNNNKLCALEIKATTNTKSKALLSFINKYSPQYVYKVSKNNLKFSTYNHLPLYALDLILANDIKGYFN